MKKILLIAAAVCVLCCQSYKSFAGNGEAANDASEQSVMPSEQSRGSSAPMVYANAYDGFVNIRATPDSKGKILGRFHNGPKGAVVLGVSGNWTKIAYGDIEGYVSSSYITSRPTKAVSVDVSSGWLFGEWVQGLCNLIIKSNGTFEYGNYFGHGYAFKGKWHLEGKDLVLVTTVWPYPEAKEDGLTADGRFPLDEQRRVIVDWKKGHLDVQAAMGV